MKQVVSILILLAAAFLLPYCNKSNDDNNGGNSNGNSNGNGNGNSNGGTFTITGTSPEWVFWGDELTIKGTGFSTNAADYTFKYLSGSSGCIDTFKSQVLSVSATQLKIKAPIGQIANGIYCGPNTLTVVVSANGKSDTTDLIKMVGWPMMIDVCSHYGGFDGNYFTPGDSAILALEGASGINGAAGGFTKNVKLRIGNDDIPFTWENATSGCGNAGGAKVILDVSKYGVRKCPGDGDWNGGWRPLTFTAYVPNTNRTVSKDFLVKWQPTDKYYGFSGPKSVSKTPGGPIQQWTITGHNMFYEKVRFSSSSCNVTPQEVTIDGGTGFYNTKTFDLPLSVLTANCTYNVGGVTPCGDFQLFGTLQVVP